MVRKPIILTNTSLCAIVRDEKMNPAGGIGRFVDSHVPFVEQAVIADTGSVDGTREILEQMQSKYPNLKIVDIPFKGYADARNKAMEHVQTKRVLILDADELLTHEKPQNDWEVLKEFIEQYPSEIYCFNFLAIPPSGIEYYQFDALSRRLFNKGDVVFLGKIWECAHYEVKEITPEVNRVSIKHFVPSQEAKNEKKENWYGGSYLIIPPSKSRGFAEWKAFNPQRDNYA